MLNNIQTITNPIMSAVQWFKAVPNRFVVVALASIVLVAAIFSVIRCFAPQSMRNTILQNNQAAIPGPTNPFETSPPPGGGASQDQTSLPISDRNEDQDSIGITVESSNSADIAPHQALEEELAELRGGLISINALRTPVALVDAITHFTRYVVNIEGPKNLDERVCTGDALTIEGGAPLDPEGWLTDGQSIVGRHMSSLLIDQDLGNQPFDVHFASTIGPRPEMEDTHIAATLSNGARMVGLFDGHGGEQVSLFLRDNIVQFLEREFEKMEANENLSDEGLQARCIMALNNAFIELDVATMPFGWTQGSTAIVILIVGQKLIVANLGDSRAIIIRDGLPIPLTVDADVHHRRYAIQVETFGGTISHGRAGGAYGLATPAAIGDHQLRHPHRHAKFIINTPEISMIDYQAGDKVVMGCDGLWDALSSNHVAERLVERTPENVPAAVSDAALLVRLAVLTPQQYDNVTVGIINL